MGCKQSRPAEDVELATRSGEAAAVDPAASADSKAQEATAAAAPADAGGLGGAGPPHLSDAASRPAVLTTDMLRHTRSLTLSFFSPCSC